MSHDDSEFAHAQLDEAFDRFDRRSARGAFFDWAIENGYNTAPDEYYHDAYADEGTRAAEQGWVAAWDARSRELEEARALLFEVHWTAPAYQNLGDNPFRDLAADWPPKNTDANGMPDWIVPWALMERIRDALPDRREREQSAEAANRSSTADGKENA